MHYRHEIDGLRAVAVVPVILFHAGFDVFSGGFIGVDIFFVISGYLITTILITELRSGHFSIARFYERRARRILPALFFVMLCCLPFAWLWMDPSQLEDFSQSLIAVSGFVSNIVFWRESGYFDAASELKPLLHTWSLAVEEQFYIFFPILLLVLWRFARRAVFSVIIVLCVASLLLSHWGSTAFPSATFYLIPTRAWELGVGCICAFVLYDRQPYKNNFLATVGLVLIFGSIFIYDVTTPFPSLWALVPVGGVAFVIVFAQRSTLAAKLLSQRPFVFIGLISYSAYLWHQPLFAFMHLKNMHAPSMMTMCSLVVLSFGLAVLSWRYIERPFRQREEPVLTTRFQVFSVSLSTMTLFAVIGIFGHLAEGAPFRQTPGGLIWEELALDERLAPNFGLGAQCNKGGNLQNVLDNPDCRIGEVPQLLLWGDSYAMHLAGVLKASTLSERHSFIQIARSQCAPILNYGMNDSGITAQECIDFNDRVMGYLKTAEDIEYVLMSSPYALSGRPAFNRNGQRQDIVDTDYGYAQMVETAETILSLGKTPIFVSPPPDDGTDIGQCLARASARQLPLDVCDYARAEPSPSRGLAFELLDRLKSSYTVIDLRDTLCSDGICIAAAEGVYLFRDTGHLSIEGADFIGREIDPFRNVITE